MPVSFVRTAAAIVLLELSGMAQDALPRVVIPIIVNSSRHQAVDITAESLVITDQKFAVTGARLLRGAELPLELGLLIDISASERDRHLNDIIRALRESVGEMMQGPDDRVFVELFDIRAHATPWLNKEQLQALPVEAKVGGATALYDAVAMACKERMGLRDWKKPTRRVLLLISDGEDNLSHVTREEATVEALKSGVVIFTVNTDESGADYRGEKVMEGMAKLTGGESFTRSQKSDVAKVLAELSSLVHGMFYISYVPPEASKAGAREVEVKPASKQKFVLTYARKYFWTP